MKNRILRIVLSLVCFFLKRKTPPSSRILVVSTTGLGDTIWAGPALASWRRAHPQIEVDLLSTSIGRSLFHSLVSNIYEIGNPALWSMVKLLPTLWKRRYAAAFIFHASQRPVIGLLPIIGIQSLYGIRGELKGLDEYYITLPPPKTHQIEKRALLLSSFLPFRFDPILFFPKIEELPSGIEHLFSSSKRIVAIHPGAKDRFKLWGASRWNELIELLHREGTEVILCATPLDSSIISLILHAHPSLICLNALSIVQLGSLFSRVDCVVSCDSGPMHIAAAVQAKQVALFSPTDPNDCGPINPHAIVLQAERTCTPCVKRRCKEALCLEQISPRRVLDAIRSHYTPLCCDHYCELERQK